MKQLQGSLPLSEPPKRWTVVLNRSAGGIAEVEESVVESLREQFHSHELIADFQLVAADDLEEAIQSATKIDGMGVAVGGGDGTLSAAAGILANGTVPLGILPLGSLNHFARDLGIPLTLPEAVEVISEGQLSCIDLGEVNGKYFINNSSIGAYPRVIRLRERKRKILGQHKWVAHAVAFYRFLRKYRTMTVCLCLDGRHTLRVTPFVFVGNNEYDLGQKFTTGRKNIQSGCLCVYTARCENWLQFLRLFALLVANRLVDAPEFELHCVDELTVETREEFHHVSRDGEIFRMQSPLRYRILSRALPVIVPHEKPI